jgi:hypothetical protein
VAVHIDRIDTLSAEELNGSIVRLVRRARVSGLVNTDYQVLFTALSQGGIPAAGSTPTGATNLILKTRNATLVDGEPGVVDVDLIYETPTAPGVRQNIDFPYGGLLLGEARASISQVKTNKDEYGDPITLEHTYPDDEPDFPGETRRQGGEIEYFQASTVVTYRGIKTTRYPWMVESALVGKVNANGWGGRGAREWLCTACAWRPLDGGADRYEFSIEFQHNPDTWDPTAVFIDERTSKPPVNLLAGYGYKTIQRLTGVDFDAVLGTTIQGA